MLPTRCCMCKRCVCLPACRWVQGLQAGTHRQVPASAWGMRRHPAWMKRRCLRLRWPRSCSTPGYMLWQLSERNPRCSLLLLASIMLPEEDSPTMKEAVSALKVALSAQSSLPDATRRSSSCLTLTARRLWPAWKPSWQSKAQSSRTAGLFMPRGAAAPTGWTTISHRQKLSTSGLEMSTSVSECA